MPSAIDLTSRGVCFALYTHCSITYPPRSDRPLREVFDQLVETMNRLAEECGGSMDWEQADYPADWRAVLNTALERYRELLAAMRQDQRVLPSLSELVCLCARSWHEYSYACFWGWVCCACSV